MALDPARVAALKARIRDVPDFPKPGVVFRDITTLLKDGAAFREMVELFAELCDGHRADTVVAVESRGFILGGALAARLGKGFVPVRKPGKLPGTALRASYSLEYGTDSLEIHADAIEKGARALIVDDVIATGGTAAAVAELVASFGAKIEGFAFLVELGFLDGREKLAGHDVRCLIRY
jgi:adenine phosphoribosyltransferase